MGKSTAAAAGGSLVGAGMGVYTAVKASEQQKEFQLKKEEQQALMKQLEANRQSISNPMQGLTNEAEKIGVATQATKIQAEEADMALANTLDTIMQTGAGSGGATALAQAALKSKQGISVDIQKQELKNAKNVASTQMKINEQKAQGNKWAWEEQENRDMQQLDRAQNKIDKFEAQEYNAEAQKMAAFGNIASSAVSGFGNIAEGMDTDSNQAMLDDFMAKNPDLDFDMLSKIQALMGAKK
jgi:hypothetical protein